MPKEMIKAADGSDYEVRLGWGPGTVQLGVEGRDARSLNWLLYGDPERRAFIGEKLLELVQFRDQEKDGSLEHLGGLLLNVLDCAPGSEFDEVRGFRGVWADLDRRACNDLIRHVRRARDTAFGHDE